MQDYFGKNADALTKKKLFLFDMDGTIYRENTLFDGIIPMFNKIKEKGGHFAFITNNPSKSVKDYLKKMKTLGVGNLTADHFFTSAQATAQILTESYKNALIYAQGTKSFIKELKSHKLRVTTRFSKEIGAIVVAFDPELTAKKLRTTCEVLTKLDVPYFATNPDLNCPVDFGAIPDCGSMCMGIYNATGKNPVYIGKPQPTMIVKLMKKFGVNKEETVVVGDRLYTDIASGINAGVDTVCVLCGEATIDDIKTAKTVEMPTFVFAHTKEIV